MHTYPSESSMPGHIIHGFSKLSRSEKLTWLRDQEKLSEAALAHLNGHLHPDPKLQGIYEEISENNVSNYYLPLGLAPNFLINGILRTVPMVTEESSVIAAASHAAKFWAMHGGFHAEVLGILKNGQIHFTWSGSERELHNAFAMIKEELLQSVESITRRMEERGGGVESLEIRAMGPALAGFYQLFVTFRTAEAMGANFINSVLETMAGKFSSLMKEKGPGGILEIIMSILSNYTPDCRVNCHVEGDTHIFDPLVPTMTGEEFARKFMNAVQVAIHDPYRAVTHNKGIFNGMDAVILATGNDFRAVEACGHAFASRNGTYSSLSNVELSNGQFRFSLETPLAVGTIGGTTTIHPLAGASLEILGHPTAEQLMEVVAATGLASNFSALRSLITTGIQRGHMKMHLGNILRQLKATPAESEMIRSHFRDRTVSYTEASSLLESIRNQNPKQ